MPPKRACEKLGEDCRSIASHCLPEWSVFVEPNRQDCARSVHESYVFRLLGVSFERKAESPIGWKC